MLQIVGEFWREISWNVQISACFRCFFFFFFLLISFFRLPVQITSLVNLSHSVSWWVICSCASFEAILVHFFYFIYILFSFFQLWFFFFFKSIFHPRSVGSPTEDHMTTGEHQSHRKTYSIPRSEQETQEARTKNCQLFYSATGCPAQRLPGMPAGSQQEWLNSWCSYIFEKEKDKQNKTRKQEKNHAPPPPPPDAGCWCTGEAWGTVHIIRKFTTGRPICIFILFVQLLD